MTTSDPTSAALASPGTSGSAAGLQAREALPAGVLSPYELSRLANGMFNALPDDLQLPASAAARAILPPNSALSGNPYATVPAPTAPSVPGLLAGVTEVQPPVFVATPDRTIPPGAQTSLPSPMTGVLPNVPATGFAPATEAAFAFVRDARPLYSEPTTEPSRAGSSAPAFGSEIPSNSKAPGNLGSLSSLNDQRWGAALPSSPITDFESPAPTRSPQPSASASPSAAIPTPAIPASLAPFHSSAFPAFSFIEEARPLFSTSPQIPGPVPAFGAPAQPENTGANSASHVNPFAEPRDANTPLFRGTVVHPPDYRALYGEDSRSGFRSLEPSNVVSPSTIHPSTLGPATLGDLGLPTYSFDVEAIRRDFPILRERVNGYPLIWLDNGATTQKPQSVIDRISYYYEHENSNVHRAAHELAARATDAYESAREKTRRFLNASSAKEIIFVRGATEAINLVAQSWGRRNVEKDDEIVITWLEHHANIVPWQMLCAEKGARLRVAPVDDSGQVLLDEYEKLLGPKTRLVSIGQVSNALGTIVPVKEMVEAARRHGARALVDGAQAVSHMRVDVQAIDCDFYVFSGHKVFAPTGIGVLYSKSEVLDQMPPWQGGGNMIQDVTFEKTLYQPPPQRFEAGTGNIADAIGLGAAIDYLDRVGIENVARHEHALLTYATEALQRIPGLHLIGTAKEKAGVLSFVMDGLKTEEIGDYLNRKGIAARGGHHCAQPILRRFGLETTLRATLALYNTCEEIDALVAALWDLRQGHSPGIL
jgi:cysteine desulfurase/selenocysteine lyase